MFLIITIITFLSNGYHAELSLNGTKWKLQVTESAADTLIFLSEDSSLFYSCEENYTTVIKYHIQGPKIYIDEYDWKSSIDLSEGKEVSSKMELLYDKEKLRVVYMAHKYLDKYKEVGAEIYKNYSLFEKVSN